MSLNVEKIKLRRGLFTGFKEEVIKKLNETREGNIKSLPELFK